MFAALAPPGTIQMGERNLVAARQALTSTVCRSWARRWVATSAARSGLSVNDGRVEVITVAHGVQHL